VHAGYVGVDLIGTRMLQPEMSSQLNPILTWEDLTVVLGKASTMLMGHISLIELGYNSSRENLSWVKVFQTSDATVTLRQRNPSQGFVIEGRSGPQRSDIDQDRPSIEFH
jgi:hypothetical protein